MIYTVTREVIQKNKIISHQNVFDNLAEAREFYDGTNGILSVCLYDENETLMSFKGEKFEVKQTPEPMEEVNNDTVVETLTATEVDSVENVQYSNQQQDTETISDDITVDDKIAGAEELTADDTTESTATETVETVADETVETVADTVIENTTESTATETVETVADTVIENLDQDIKLEVDAGVSDTAVDEIEQIESQDSDEYVQAEFNTVTTESNDKIRQLVLEEPIINKINTAPTYSFINKN
jgi:hypothetical protein